MVPVTVWFMPMNGPRRPTRVVAPSAGVSVRTRLRLEPDERVVLAAVGAHLTRARNADLAAARRGEKANDRYKILVEDFAVHSRYAGTICVDNDAATKAAKDHLWRHRAGLRRAIATLERRTAATPRSVCGCGERRGCAVCRDGYATPTERWQKQRRLASRAAELARVEAQLVAKDYPVVYGGRRLAGTRHHLEKAGLTQPEWRRAWTEARTWFGCAGNTGKPGGNPCLALARGEGGHWYLTVSVPRPVAEQLGVATRVQLRHPVVLHHRGRELERRLDGRLAVRLDVAPSTDTRGRLRTYLRVSWVRPTPEVIALPAARAGGVVGVDLNADHLAAARIDTAGNPVGRPLRVPLDLAGVSQKTRDGRLRAAITTVLEYAMATGATAVAVEDLDFGDDKTREKFGRRKTFRHLIARVPHHPVQGPDRRHGRHSGPRGDRGRPPLHLEVRRCVLAARPVHPHSHRDPARRCLGRDRTPRPRVRPHHPGRPHGRRRETASAARPPPARWKHRPHPCGPGTGNRRRDRGRPPGRRPPSTRSHTTALPAPTPNLGCGHARRAVGAGDSRS